MPGISDYFVSVIKELQGAILKYGEAHLIPNTQTFEDGRNWKFEIKDGIVRDIESKEIAIEYEKVLNYLIAVLKRNSVSDILILSPSLRVPLFNSYGLCF